MKSSNRPSGRNQRPPGTKVAAVAVGVLGCGASRFHNLSTYKSHKHLHELRSQLSLCDKGLCGIPIVVYTLLLNR